MTIEVLTKNAKDKKDIFTEGISLYYTAYDVLINQLTILARENDGILPNEFILSDNKELFLTLDNITKILQLIDLKIVNISDNVSIQLRINGDIPETVYTDEYYKLYHVVLLSPSK